jgi:hypothetical protein
VAAKIAFRTTQAVATTGHQAILFKTVILSPLSLGLPYRATIVERFVVRPLPSIGSGTVVLGDAALPVPMSLSSIGTAPFDHVINVVIYRSDVEVIMVDTPRVVAGVAALVVVSNL